MNDEQQKLSYTINELTGKTRTKDFDWVVKTIIQFKDNIDEATKKLSSGQIEKGFEELNLLFIEWQKEAIHSNLTKITDSTTDLI